MVIQADLADRHHLRVRQQRGEAAQRFLIRPGGVVRVNAHRGVNEGVAVGQPDTGFQIRRSFSGADGHQLHDTGRERAFDHRFPVIVELVVIEMAMRIDELHRKRVPTGTSSSKPTSTGLPPSATAATTMPLDSMPRSFRGSRLATITTLRPSSAAGS